MLKIEGIKGHKVQINKLSFLIQKSKIPQTLLFSGISGIGKKIIARSFLSNFFCQGESSPCNICNPCRQIVAGTFPDYIEISPGKKGSIPIGSEEKKEPGTVRWLIDKLSRKSINGKYAVLIDGIDKISIEGQNALLKTIEEPNENVYIVLISSGRAKILPTILSRCFELKFYPIPEKDIEDLLSEKGFASGDSFLLSKLSGGSMELLEIILNESFFEQIVDLCREISSYLKENSVFNIDLKKILNDINSDIFVDIILNIYNLNLFILYNEEVKKNIFFNDKVPESSYSCKIEDILFEDKKIVIALIRIFIAVKKGRANNLNIRNSIKGMLYSYNKPDIRELPYFSGI